MLLTYYCGLKMILTRDQGNQTVFIAPPRGAKIGNNKLCVKIQMKSWHLFVSSELSYLYFTRTFK